VEFRADDATQLIQTIASVASRNGRSLRTMVVVRPWEETRCARLTRQGFAAERATVKPRASSRVV